nr:hypothetical protein [Tanacetum cinerariifolium]
MVKFRNQRTVNVAGAREKVGSLIVQQSGIQCFNCKEFRHFAKECRKPKRVKDSAYHKDKMFLCKQAEQVQAVEATDDSPAVPEHTTVEKPINMSPENKAHFEAEKEAIHLILTGIGDEIYSTIDACQTTQEMWEAIERLQQVNELRAERLARNANPLALVATAQAKQDPYYQTSKSHKSHAPSSKPSILTRSHTNTRHKGKEIAKPITPPSKTAFEEDNDPKQAQRYKDMQKNLALIAKYFKKIYKPTNNNLRTSSKSRNKNADMTPRFKNNSQSGQFGNQRTVNVAGARENIGKSRKGLRTPHITRRRCCCASKLSKEVPTADLGTDSKPVEQVQNNVGYNVFTNNLQHSEQSESVSNTCLVETNDSNVILDSLDIYMAKIQEVPTADLGTDSKPVEQVQNNVGYNVFTNNLQHSEQSESVSNTCLVETNDSNVILDSLDMCEDDIQNDPNDVESDDERVVLANVIANLKLDVDENKNIQKKLKKANTTLA